MDITLTDVIDRQARQAPDGTAAVFGEHSLSYAELGQQSTSLAESLAACGIRHGDRIGIYLNKSLRLPVAMYGILKAGAAFVPLDPAACVEQTIRVIQDCGIRLLISAGNIRAQLRQVAARCPSLSTVIGIGATADLAIKCLAWSDALLATAKTPGEQQPLPDRLLGDDLAYILYTHDANGHPRGIMHTHHSALSFARWAADEYGLRPADRMGNHCQLQSRQSMLDYFAAAQVGAATIIVAEDLPRLPAEFAELLEDQQITVLTTVPFILLRLLLRGRLAERRLTALRWIIFGGERLSCHYLGQLQQQLPHSRFDNLYGTREVHGCSHVTLEHMADDQLSMPIGLIGRNSDILVATPDGQPVADGDIGELLVRTPAMMHGYWGRADLNRQTFVDYPVAGGYCHRYCRTGDIARRDKDGMLWLIGRKERRLVINNHLVELDNIESRLNRLPQVEQAAAVAIHRNQASPSLHLAIVLHCEHQIRDNEQLMLAALQQALGEPPSLQELATSYRFCHHLPRTKSGTVDHQALVRQAASAPDWPQTTISQPSEPQADNQQEQECQALCGN